MPETIRKRRKAEMCYNCGASLLDAENFCPNCGQENHSKQASIKHLFNDFLGDYLAFDSRLFRSVVPLITEPGRVTIDYLDGKRQQFIPPIRVFLFLSFLYFGLSFLTGQDSSAFEFTADGSEKAANAVSQAYARNFNILLFLYAPLFALLIRLFFRTEKHHFYVNFFVFTLHLFSFFFIIGTVQILLFTLCDAIFSEQISSNISVFIQLGFLLYSIYYAVISLKRVFNKSYTILRFVAVFFISIIAFLLLLLIAILILFFLNQ
ncbi:MAG: DUF3667 domain-containing protein [Crocinitomicaceae bacterium]|nr:DUF3667 domain-containing protein [Crocinitomicaceae bacterium]